MKWRVTGADRQTGEDRTVVVNANDEESAVRHANQLGLIVDRATPEASIPNPTTAAPLTPPPAPPRDPLQELEYAVRRPAGGQRGRTNNYLWLRVAAVILRVFAIGCYVLGTISFVLLLWATADSGIAGGGGNFSNAAPSLILGLIAVSPAVGILVLGAIVHMLAEIGLAVRDIARKQ